MLNQTPLASYLLKHHKPFLAKFWHPRPEKKQVFRPVMGVDPDPGAAWSAGKSLRLNWVWVTPVIIREDIHLQFTYHLITKTPSTSHDEHETSNHTC